MAHRQPGFALHVSCPKERQSPPGFQLLCLLLACFQPIPLQPARTCNWTQAVGQAGTGLLCAAGGFCHGHQNADTRRWGWTGSPTTTAHQLCPVLSPSPDPSTSPCPWPCSSALTLSAHPSCTLRMQRCARGSPGSPASQTHAWH